MMGRQSGTPRAFQSGTPRAGTTVQKKRAALTHPPASTERVCGTLPQFPPPWYTQALGTAACRLVSAQAIWLTVRCAGGLGPPLRPWP
eukprot:294183-Chlamydomonas_euryale.AAC.3